MSDMFSISNIYNLGSTQLSEIIGRLKNGSADERKLFAFMAKSADADKNGTLDINEFMQFVSKVDKRNAKKTADGEISDAEIEKMFGKKAALKDAFLKLISGLTNSAESQPIKTDKIEDTLGQNLRNMVKNDPKSEGATLSGVKENNSEPKAKFNGVEYSKSMTLTYKDGTKVVAYCDANGNIIGYNKVKYDKEGNKVSKTSYTADGDKSSVVKYENGKQASKEIYDEEGRLSSKTLYDANGKAASKEVYGFDENGKSFVETKKTYKDGVLKSAVRLNKDGVELEKSKYDKDGHLKTRELYSYKEDGTKIVKQRNKYTTDENGKITSKDAYKLDSGTGKMYLEAETNYNVKDGISRPEQTIIYYPGKVVKEIREYDENGLVSKSTKYNNDKEHTVASTNYYKDGVKIEEQSLRSQLAQILEQLKLNNEFQVRTK